VTAPPVLLLHGALGSSEQLAPLAERLRARLAVELLDFEGHGDAPARGRASRIEHFAENAAEAIERRLGGRAAIFGYSMGGYVALHLAAARPELVSRVATLGTKLRWSAEDAAREGEMLDAARIRAKVPRFADALAARHRAAGWEAVLAATREMMTALGARPLLDAATLATIPHPVRVMVGDRDATVSLDECVEAYRALGAGELEVLPGTPHPFEKVNLDRLASSLIKFFGGR
jgi:pimeloyl-ACP methyl ester carboxylesterase